MSEHNITVECGSSIRLPTAGKYCDRDVVVSAEMSIDGFIASHNWSEDMIQSSIDTDGSIYNGVGYKTGYRLNSSANEVESSADAITGFIPYESGDVFLFRQSTSNHIQYPQYIWGYDEYFNKLNLARAYSDNSEIMLAGSDFFAKCAYDRFDGGTRYLRFSLTSYTIWPYTIHKAVKM